MLKSLVFHSSELAAIACFGIEPAVRGKTIKRTISHVDSATGASMVRASKRIVMKLINRANENFGMSSELLIDTDSGQVENLTMLFGGFRITR